MSVGLILIIIVVAAYLAAHVLFDWLGRRFLIVSGAEYLLLGILLGPEVARVLDASVVSQFAPFMTLALGWIGALIGAQFRLTELMRIPGVLFRVAFLEAILSFAAVAAISTLMLIYFLDASTYDASIAGTALGAIAAASAPSGIALVAHRVGRHSPLLKQLQLSTAIDSLVAIVAFGILVSVVHADPPGVRAPTGTEWAVISISIGLVGGALFHLFLGEERNVDRLFIAVGGALVLASGAAAYLQLSPLLSTLLIGAVLVNTSKTAGTIRDVLTRVERPLYYVLLLFVGAAWSRAPGALWLLPVVLFLVVRWIAKLGSARLAARMQGTLDEVGAGWGRALLGHGGLAVALAFNYKLLAAPGVPDGPSDLPFPEIVFTAAILSMLLTEFTSARLVMDVIASYRRRARAALQSALGVDAAEADALLDQREAEQAR
jgi:hypothetical protein